MKSGLLSFSRIDWPPSETDPDPLPQFWKNEAQSQPEIKHSVQISECSIP